MKNVRIKVRENCTGNWFGFGIYEGIKLLFSLPGDTRLNRYRYKTNAIRNAKLMAERIRIPYSDELIKEHGC